MKFKCPKCESNRLEEIADGATVSTEILDIEDGGSINYGEPSVDEAYTDRYQCLNCGWVLPVSANHTPDSEELFQWLEENNMVVFRYHDLPHAANVDLIEAGFSADLGWSEFEIGEGKFQSPFKSLGELVDFLKSHFQTSTIRVVGDRNMAISTIGIQLGAAGRLTQVSRLNEEIDVLIIGEAREWETIEYARDALEMGGNTALIVLGHADSEEPGMEYVAKWLKELIPEVPVQFVPAGNPLWAPH